MVSKQFNLFVGSIQNRMSETQKDQKLLPDKPEDKDKQSPIDKAKAYYKYQMFFDRFATDSVLSNTLKAIFNVLIKLSYFFFIAAVMLMNLVDGEGKTSFLNFIKDTNNQTQLYVLIGLGVSILTLFKVFKQDSKISKEKRKQINFMTDSLRAGTYIYLLIFINPFVTENSQNNAIFYSYWLFCAAIILFVIRKLLKWYYYYVKEGKYIYTPWENKYVPDQKNMKDQSERIKIQKFVNSLIADRQNNQKLSQISDSK